MVEWLVMAAFPLLPDLGELIETMVNLHISIALEHPANPGTVTLEPSHFVFRSDL